LRSEMKFTQAKDGAGGAKSGVEPDGLAGGSERGVREGQAESFRDDLRGGSGAQELAASSRRSAGSAAEVGGLLEGDLVLGVARADGLDPARVFAVFGKEGDASGDKNAGQWAGGGESHHHGGESLVACGDADDSGARGEGAHESAEDDSGVVAIRERVEHADGSLGAAVAGIGAGSGEGDCVERFEFAGGFGYQQTYFPVSGVKAECDGSSVGGAEAPVGAEDEDFGAEKLGGIPSHAGILS